MTGSPSTRASTLHFIPIVSSAELVERWVGKTTTERIRREMSKRNP